MDAFSAALQHLRNTHDKTIEGMKYTYTTGVHGQLPIVLRLGKSLLWALQNSCSQPAIRFVGAGLKVP